MWTPSFLVALAAIVVMGFATQRGGTCTVAAIEEIVAERRFRRLIALIEASLWVGGGLVLLNGAGLVSVSPSRYAAGLATAAGGALFGVGAFVNRACAFSTIARLGAGEWSYVATPVGIFLGSYLVLRLPATERFATGSDLMSASLWFTLLILAGVAARLASHGWTIRRRRVAPLDHIWSPHVATTIIGLAFLIALATFGSWTYTDTLTAIARGKMLDLAPRLLLYAALLGGAVVGGWSAGRFRSVPPTVAGVCRCLIGGTLMGASAILIPGGNDGLVLVAMPLLLPYAWLAFASMCITIYAALRLRAVLADTSRGEPVQG